MSDCKACGGRAKRTCPVCGPLPGGMKPRDAMSMPGLRPWETDAAKANLPPIVPSAIGDLTPPTIPNPEPSDLFGDPRDASERAFDEAIGSSMIAEGLIPTLPVCRDCDKPIKFFPCTCKADAAWEAKLAITDANDVDGMYDDCAEAMRRYPTAAQLGAVDTCTKTTRCRGACVRVYGHTGPCMCSADHGVPGRCPA